MAVRREPEERLDPFPWLVTLGCVALGLVIFLHSTRPALAERAALEQAERRLAVELDAARRAASESQRRKATLGDDPEQLLVEIDRHGLTPQDAAEQHADQHADRPVETR